MELSNYYICEADNPGNTLSVTGAELDSANGAEDNRILITTQDQKVGVEYIIFVGDIIDTAGRNVGGFKMRFANTGF